MARPNLPVNIDTTYADSGADATIKTHQQHHDVVHGVVNAFDTGLKTATSGQVLTWNGTVYAPAAATGGSGEAVSVKSFGAVGNGITDDTAAIAACLAASPAGSRIYFPAGTYIVSGTGNIFTLNKANIEMFGSGIDSTVIKIKNANGDFARMFVSGSSAPVRLYVHDLTFNSNITNNPLSSVVNLMATKYRFLFDLDNSHNATFERIRFTNADNVGCMLFGDSDNVRVHDCVFDAIGRGAYHDHSTINVRGNGTKVKGCRFIGVGPSAWTAIELHGSGVEVSGNITHSFGRFGIHCGDTALGFNSVWVHNQGLRCGNGIEMWSYDVTSGTPNGPSVRDVIISDNIFEIDLDKWATDMPRAMGINLQVGSDAVVQRVKIVDNMVNYLPFTAPTTSSVHAESNGIGFVRGGNIVLTGSGPADTDIDIRGNTISNSISAGINIEGFYRLWRLRIQDNTIVNPGSGSVNTFYFKGITIYQPSSRGFALTDAVVSNNQVIDTRATGKITAAVDTTNVGYATGNRAFNNYGRRVDGVAVTQHAQNRTAAWATA